jgi:phosphatidylinositol alpha-mannosyltransferase
MRLDEGAVVSEAARVTACAVVGGRARSYALCPNAVDVERFSSAQPWSVEAPTALFVGRHESRKGLEVLLAAVAELPGDVRLSVVGSGPETVRLRERYPDPRIEWLGRVSDDEVASRLAGAQLFVAPSLGGESFGVVLLEAMAAGVPIVCSDLDGYRLAGGDVPTYVEPGDVSALAAAMGRVLGDSRVRPRPDDLHDADDAVARGRLRAADFSFASLASSYVSLYEAARDG